MIQRGFKWIFIIAGFVLAVVLAGGGYYFGTKNASLQKETSEVSISFPTKSQALIDKTVGWQTYTSEKFNFTVKYPPYVNVTHSDYSLIFSISKTRIGGPSFPVLYVSAIPDGFTNEGSLVYNFMSKDMIDSFYALNVGDSKQTQTGRNSDFFMFTKLPNTTVAGINGVTIENKKVWEGSKGLVDKLVIIRRKGFTYMLGTYYETSDELSNFQTFLSSFQFIK